METILIIDDDVTTLRTIGRQLELAGFKAAVLKNGTDALKTVKSLQPSAVLLDIVMPDREGFETATELRQHFPELPIIAISGYLNYLGMMSVFGSIETLPKPIDPVLLIKTLAVLGVNP